MEDLSLKNLHQTHNYGQVKMDQREEVNQEHAVVLQGTHTTSVHVACMQPLCGKYFTTMTILNCVNVLSRMLFFFVFSVFYVLLSFIW